MDRVIAMVHKTRCCNFALDNCMFLEVSFEFSSSSSPTAVTLTTDGLFESSLSTFMTLFTISPSVGHVSSSWNIVRELITNFFVTSLMKRFFLLSYYPQDMHAGDTESNFDGCSFVMHKNAMVPNVRRRP